MVTPKTPNYASLDSETKGLISYQLKSSGVKSMASGFADIANGYINYTALRTESGFLKNQADAVELAAKEQANNLRSEFIEAVGNANYDAARRGVKVTSANLWDNLERSSIDVNSDIRKSEENATSQARMMRMRAKNMNKSARTALVTGAMSGISNIAGGAATYGMGGKVGG